MISIVPRLNVSVPQDESRTAAQILALGGDSSERPGYSVAIRFDADGGARALLARALIDLLVRLEPLVGHVLIQGPGEGDIARDLALRYPVELDYPRVPPPVQVDIAVGRTDRRTDFLVDGAGWIAALGTTTEASDDGNPVGPLVAADFAAAEVFKGLFARAFPQSPFVTRFTTWSGEFSTYSYQSGGPSPRMGPIMLEGVVVGAGGVSAGTLLVLGALGSHLSGHLALIDHDVVMLHNLNRLLYATVVGARRQRLKVDEAKTYLTARCPSLVVDPYPELFGTYKSRTPRRRDRRFPLVVTGLDSDEARLEVQRETPCVLIDGSTGANANLRVERVHFGSSACLGCTRRGVGPAAGVGCDVFPDRRAPSISFLSALPGILAGGEIIKHAMGGEGALPGYFEHTFFSGPNEEMAGVPARRSDCLVGCDDRAVLAQFDEKCRSGPR